ncbi:MAG: hypothetical protein HGB26_07625 [Desulfobulbaceae bacterium]|nr:hypothetical protein [Desulfobulbaceae bacterium]
MESQDQNWYLRIEAVNLDHSVFDTHNISTIRGGSFNILNAVSEINNVIKELQVISTGASVGIFRIVASGENGRNIILKKVLDYLQDNYGDFATFVCEVLQRENGEKLNNVIRRLTVGCSWQQYQTPSLIFPEISESLEECFLDGVRPATKQFIATGNKNRHVSKAVDVRLDKGRELRNKLYEKLLGGNRRIKFTDDLESLACDDKIAFIHLDGNKFGKIREDYYEEVVRDEEFRTFDLAVQESLQKKALEKILHIATDPNKTSFCTVDGKVRLETLMWGGDEIEWIVPAQQAWSILKAFFEQAAASPFQSVNDKAIPLTYSAGVVFCRHNLPILQVRRYAEQLCSLAKSHLPLGNVADNRFAFINIASFDIINRDVDSFLRKYHDPATIQDFTITFSEMTSLYDSLTVVKKWFPKNKLYDIINELRLRSGKNIVQLKDRALTMVSRDQRDTVESALNDITASYPNRWMVIGDLWSYVGVK